MSFFPSPVLVRLQELKLWQGNYDNLLQNKSKNGTSPSDFDTIEGLSAISSSRSSPLSSPERDRVDWDKKTIAPAKPFEQLLEEKLALDNPINVQAKPKRPFLKKGAGLKRYKLNEKPLPRRKSQSRTSTERIKKNDQIRNRKYSNSLLTPTKSCLKSSKVYNEHRKVEIDLTPLKMPDFSIKSIATWHKALEEENVSKLEKTEDDKLCEDIEMYKNSFNSHVLGKINEFNLRRLLPPSPRKSILNRSHSDSISTIPEVDSENSSPSVDHQYEKTMENELRIFEALEERVEHSSFSSSNSSIIRLLSSTPNKVKNKLLEEKKVMENEARPPGYHIQGIQNSLLQQKLREVNERTDVLHDFLKNLRRIGSCDDKKGRSLTESGHDRTPDTSFSDDEKWSTNTDTDDNDTTYKGDTPLKRDVAVNTSLEETYQQMLNEKCHNCDELQIRLEKVSKQLPDIQAEKARVCDFAKELESKRDQLNREMDRMKEKHENVISELKQELENEKKRFTREKMVFDMYVKDSKNRPTKREREDISDLKKELIDVKELLKLKETKSGATQARLRTQIKQLEKENGELKQEVEKLQRDNSKLSATQLMRRPSEVKMLHEINRNLTKLTEETLKKQLNRTDMSCNTDSTEEVKKKAIKKTKVNIENKNVQTSPSVKKKSFFLKQKSPESDKASSSANDLSKYEMTTFANLSLEKQYENVFGQFSSLAISNNSLNDSKKERTELVFEDGSKEIKYSNGNTKTISPDGSLIIVKYYNGDIKETNLTENTLKYYYAENATWHIQYPDGSEVLEYPNGQKEKMYQDGRREVKCADGSFLVKSPDGSEEIEYPDGSKIIKNPDGDKILLLPNGQKEIHTKEHKRREYPDGTVKILYPEGTQETRYASGRIRIKDANGVLLVDSQNSVH